MFFEEHRGAIGHYFRSFYRIMRYIDDDVPVSRERVKYARILRAQLSSQEEVLIFYNCLSRWGVKLRKVIEKPEYKMLKTLEPKLLAMSQHVFMLPLSHVSEEYFYFPEKWTGKDCHSDVVSETQLLIRGNEFETSRRADHPWIKQRLVLDKWREVFLEDNKSLDARCDIFLIDPNRGLEQLNTVTLRT